jgi:hypothetical protein
MAKVREIVSMLALSSLSLTTGCAESSSEQRRTVTTPSESSSSESSSAASAEAISPDRQDAIERLFARKATELQDCWAREYEKSHNRKLEGDITVGMDITPSGSPSHVRVLKSTINNSDIEGCVQQQVAAWSFPEGQNTVPYMRTVHLGAQF